MPSSKDDLEFITHAKQDIPLLIAEIEYLKSMLSKLQRSALEVEAVSIALKAGSTMRKRFKISSEVAMPCGQISKMRLVRC